jgi:hypothetical protein
MSAEEYRNLLISLADSLEDLRVLLDGNEVEDWTLERLAAMIANGSDFRGLIPIARSLLRRFDNQVDLKKQNSWSTILSSQLIGVPILSVHATEADSNRQPTLLDCLEYLHILATTLQQKQLAKSQEKTPNEATATGFPMNLLGSDASDSKKELLLEGYQYLKEDYEERRKGMQQRFQVLMETNFGDEDLAALQDRQPRELELVEDIPSLVQRFLRPHSSSHAQRTRMTTGSISVVSKVADTPIDRGGRAEDDSRVSMPDWQEEPPEKLSKPNSNQKVLGQAKKQQGNSKGKSKSKNEETQQIQNETNQPSKKQEEVKECGQVETSNERKTSPSKHKSRRSGRNRGDRGRGRGAGRGGGSVPSSSHTF